MPFFRLALSSDKTKAVCGMEGVDTAAAGPTNNDDARVIRFFAHSVEEAMRWPSAFAESHRPF